jgi:hypothetical protein
MNKKLRLSISALVLILSSLAVSSKYQEKYDVILLDFHDPGYFRIQYAGHEYNIWFYYRTFKFDQLRKIHSRFPMTATITFSEQGLFLTLDDHTTGLVSGTQVAKAIVSECFDKAQSTYDFVGCSSKHYLALKYQRDGLMSYLKNQKLEPELMVMLDQIEESQNQSLRQHQQLLEYMDNNRSLGSIFSHQYYEEQFQLLEAQIAQLNFILRTY